MIRHNQICGSVTGIPEAGDLISCTSKEVIFQQTSRSTKVLAYSIHYNQGIDSAPPSGAAAKLRSLTILLCVTIQSETLLVSRVAMAQLPKLPVAQSALKIEGANTVILSEGIPLPDLGSLEILVRVAYVCINPIDGKSAEMSPTPGATPGVDFSGHVVALGSDVGTAELGAKLTAWYPSVGDKVFGFIFGNNPLRPDNGAFAEYVAVPSQLVWHVPSGMDLSTAATLGLPLATSGLALFHYLPLSMPQDISKLSKSDVNSPNHHLEGDTSAFVLVYGGGTATGAMAIQLLKWAGYTPITTCSTTSAERALRLGAVATFDYKLPTCGAEIREFTRDNLTLTLDCISDATSMSSCYEAMGKTGGHYLSLEPFPLRLHTRRSVAPDWIFAATIFGHEILWTSPFNIDPRLEDFEFAKKWTEISQKVLDEGLIEPHPREVKRGGLLAAIEGIEQVRTGRVRGTKLVYPIYNEVSAQ